MDVSTWLLTITCQSPRHRLFSPTRLGQKSTQSRLYLHAWTRHAWTCTVYIRWPITNINNNNFKNRPTTHRETSKYWIQLRHVSKCTQLRTNLALKITNRSTTIESRNCFQLSRNYFILMIHNFNL